MFTSINGYGFGWFIDDDDMKEVSHFGDINGFVNHLVMYPDEELVAIVLSNINITLVTQISRDLIRIVFEKKVDRVISRVADWHPPSDFVKNVLDDASQETIQTFSEQLEDLLQRPVLGEVSEGSMEAAMEWDAFCSSFFKAYQEVALAVIK